MPNYANYLYHENCRAKDIKICDSVVMYKKHNQFNTLFASL